MAELSVPSKEQAPLLRWPPPGLERMQADLWRVASGGALAGAILVLPLVFVVTGEQGFASLGPFADAWWVTLVLATVGLGFAVDAHARVARMLRRVSTALTKGYDWRTVGYVLADLRRDMGFLMQGRRHFSVLDGRERAAIAGLRVLSAVLFACAGLWLPVALATMLLLASRAGASPTAVWSATLLPAGVAYLLGGAVSATEDGRVRRARRRWHLQPWAADLVAEEIGAWRAAAIAHDGETAPGVPHPGRAPILRRFAILMGALSALVAVPVLTLVPASALGPALASIAVPHFGEIQQRAAAVEGLRPYRVASDPTLGPQEAGRLLQTLLYVGAERAPREGERGPERRIDRPWIPGVQTGGPLGVEPHRWPEELFGLVRAGLDADAQAYLEALASHPAHAVYSRLARAAHIDVAAGRWERPFPPGVSIANVPIPGVGVIRSASYAHLSVAAHQLATGRAEAAEETVRETIALGFLLGDQGPTLLENLVGHLVAGAGGTALERLYAVTGRADEAREIRGLRESAERSARRIHQAAPVGPESLVRSMPALVTDTGAVRGLRWEYFILTTTLSPCLNLNGMVFGPGEEYTRFVERARAALVVWPSEEDLFRLARAGYWGATDEESWIGRILGVSMRAGDGTCGNVVRRLRALDQVVM